MYKFNNFLWVYNISHYLIIIENHNILAMADQNKNGPTNWKNLKYQIMQAQLAHQTEKEAEPQTPERSQDEKETDKNLGL